MRDFFLWKLCYSVRDPNYGILLGIQENINWRLKVVTEKGDLVIRLVYHDITQDCMSYRDSTNLKILEILKMKIIICC